MGLFDSLNFNIFIFTLLMVSIFLMVHDKSKNWFLAISFIVSYMISYFLYTTSILNVFLYSKYIWIINFLIGSISVYYGIIKIYEYDNVKNDTKSVKTGVKIDVPLPLLFSVIFLAFILNSINFIAPTTMTSKLLFAISSFKMTIFSYYFYIITYIIFFTIALGIIASLGTLIINKYIEKKSKKCTTFIGSLMLILIGFVVMFL